MELAQNLPRVPTDALKRSRYQGCLLGGAVGDALGAAVEFMTLAEIQTLFGLGGIRDFVPAYDRPGAITDDTQMTLFTADGMLRAYVRSCLSGSSPEFGSMTARAYLGWLETQGIKSALLQDLDEEGWLLTNRDLFHRRAPGNTCISALKAMTAPYRKACNDSKGCGGVMRAAPVGMFTANWADDYLPGAGRFSLEETFAIGVEIAAVTHGHPTGQLTAGVFAVILALVLVGKDLHDAANLARSELKRHPQHYETLAAIDLAVSLAAKQVPGTEAIRALGEGWIAEEALSIGLYCALTAKDFKSGNVLAVNHDGDSDSTGSIAGNVLGALLGIDAIPEPWLAQLEMRDVIGSVADDLGSVRDWVLDSSDADTERAFYVTRYPGG